MQERVWFHCDKNCERITHDMCDARVKNRHDGCIRCSQRREIEHDKRATTYTSKLNREYTSKIKRRT